MDYTEKAREFRRNRFDKALEGKDSVEDDAKWLRRFAAELLRDVAKSATQFDDDNFEFCNCGMKVARELERRAAGIEGGE